MASPAISREDWQTIAARTAARNGLVEIRPDLETEGAGNDAGSVRVRLLHADDAGWLVEEPGDHGQRSIEPGMHVIGVINNGSQRLGFRSLVLARESCQLNAKRRLSALRLGEPTEVHSAQRRAFYRVATQGLQVPPVWLWGLTGDQADVRQAEPHIQRWARAGDDAEVDLDAIRPPVGPFLTGQLHDISGGGMAVMLDPRHIAPLKDISQLWLEFYIPTNSAPLAAAGKPVRLTKRSSVAILLGIAFSPAHRDAYLEFLTDTICEFAAEQQRRRLRAAK